MASETIIVMTRNHEFACMTVRANDTWNEPDGRCDIELDHFFLRRIDR